VRTIEESEIPSEKMEAVCVANDLDLPTLFYQRSFLVEKASSNDLCVSLILDCVAKQAPTVRKRKLATCVLKCQQTRLAQYLPYILPVDTRCTNGYEPEIDCNHRTPEDTRCTNGSTII
jgi:hypothetical protein